MLWDMLAAEQSNVRRRNALLGAAILAGGEAEDERLFAWLGQQKAIKEERTMAALALALGPPRQRGVANFWSRSIGPTRSPVQILDIAARLAAARIPGSASAPGAPVLTDDDPGLAGATAYAGLPVPQSIWNRRFNLRDPKDHDDLFWRGAMLYGARLTEDSRKIAPQLLAKAQQVAGLSGVKYAAARQAAALLRSARDDVSDSGPRPQYELLELLASNRRSAVKVRKWLEPAPHPRDQRPQRLAVSYVLSRGDPRRIVDDHAIWATDSRVNREIAIALAWRLLHDDVTAIPDVQIRELPEWFFVRWAAGLEATPMLCADLTLAAMATLAADGRLPRAAAKQALEEALWRWGSHPGLGLYEAERLLVRDMLLVGGNEGTKFVAEIDYENRYRPTGIGPSSKFYLVAIALYEHFSTPRLPLPPQYRLR